MFDVQSVLFLSAHPDDETNAAGTLHKFIRNGMKVDYVVFSDCEEDSIKRGFDPSDLNKEMKRSLDFIGIPGRCRSTVGLRVRYFLKERQTICDTAFRLNRVLTPDLVIIPNKNDLHQDHCVIRDEARRAFRDCSIFGYESIRAPLASNNLCFMDLSDEDFAAKAKCLESYETQSSRFDIEARLALARIRGSQVGCEYAEAFEVMRLRG